MKKSIFFLAFLLTPFINCTAQFTKLHDFNGASGSNPSGSLIFNETFLYGTTNGGGTKGYGTVFKTSIDGSGDANLINFDSLNGRHPLGSLVSDGTYFME